LSFYSQQHQRLPHQHNQETSGGEEDKAYRLPVLVVWINIHLVRTCKFHTVEHHLCKKKGHINKAYRSRGDKARQKSAAQKIQKEQTIIENGAKQMKP